ncbi:MAG TPA: tetratricopeptide repeat protein [Rhizomicrobium sp.]|nr:tetratricopeptide repeat protein [Rhizomicrobium sp.]
MFASRLCLLSGLVFAALSTPVRAAETAGARYADCLHTAGLDPARALSMATEWSKNKGGAPAEHCAAVALVELKRYPEAAARLDRLGRAPDMGKFRPDVFAQAGNAWMMAGDADRAVASFSAALALSANDADLYADLARAQAMRKSWAEAEADLNEALSLQPRRPDFLVLRASARDAQGKLKEARQDVDQALTLKPLAPEALVERGQIAKHAGDVAAARRDFQNVLKVQSSGEAAETARQELNELDATSR